LILEASWRESSKLAEGLLPRGIPRATIFVALGLGLVSFCIHFALSRMLDAHGAIARINLFFDCDTGWYLEGFESGAGGIGSYGGRGMVHPNVANFVHPPVMILSKVVGAIGGERAESRARHALALAVAPLAAATGTAFLFLSLTIAGQSVGAALLAVALSLASFSGLMFGVLPESFPLTGAIFSFIFYLVSLSARRGEIAPLPWLIGGTLLFSVTTTNIVPFAMILALTVYVQTRSFESALRCSGKIVLGSIALTGALFVLLTAAHGAFGRLSFGGGQLEDLHRPTLEAFWSFPRALMYTLVPPQPNTLLASADSEPGEGRRGAVVRFTFRNDLDQIKQDDKAVASTLPAEGDPVLGAIVIALFLSSVTIALYNLPRVDGALKTLFLAALALLGFNWIFHSIFGKELFLYSQHWQVALMVVLSMALVGRSWVGIVGRFSVLLLTLAAAIRSGMVIHFILSMTGV